MRWIGVTRIASASRWWWGRPRWSLSCSASSGRRSRRTRSIPPCKTGCGIARAARRASAGSCSGTPCRPRLARWIGTPRRIASARRPSWTRTTRLTGRYDAADDATDDATYDATHDTARRRPGHYIGALVVTATPAPNASGQVGYVLTAAGGITLWLPADTFELGLSAPGMNFPRATTTSRRSSGGIACALTAPPAGARGAESEREVAQN